jgi:hypothetical protein
MQLAYDGLTFEVPSLEETTSDSDTE